MRCQVHTDDAWPARETTFVKPSVARRHRYLATVYGARTPDAVAAGRGVRHRGCALRSLAREKAQSSIAYVMPDYRVSRGILQVVSILNPFPTLIILEMIRICDASGIAL